jgi:hypothetical protein
MTGWPKASTTDSFILGEDRLELVEGIENVDELALEVVITIRNPGIPTMGMERVIVPVVAVAATPWFGLKEEIVGVLRQPPKALSQHPRLDKLHGRCRSEARPSWSGDRDLNRAGASGGRLPHRNRTEFAERASDGLDPLVELLRA